MCSCSISRKVKQLYTSKFVCLFDFLLPYAPDGVGFVENGGYPLLLPKAPGRIVGVRKGNLLRKVEADIEVSEPRCRAVEALEFKPSTARSQPVEKPAMIELGVISPKPEHEIGKVVVMSVVRIFKYSTLADMIRAAARFGHNYVAGMEATTLTIVLRYYYPCWIIVIHAVVVYVRTPQNR